nr:retrovirus-related Pol polyprotein from transposon TNT 1-94 [Tanacetum cinerariifolium]
MTRCLKLLHMDLFSPSAIRSYEGNLYTLVIVDDYYRKVIGRDIRKSGLYVMKLWKKPKDKVCLTTIVENSILWHRILGHVNMRLIHSLASKELVRNLPKLKFDQHFCDACKIRKQAHASHKVKNIVSMTRCLKLLHMDLFSPSAIRSYEGNLYTLVIVDDYYRPDIMFSVCLCARFQEDPKTSHLEAVKRIFRYIKGQKWERLPRNGPLIGRTAPKYIWDRQDRHQETLPFPGYKYRTISCSFLDLLA